MHSSFIILYGSVELFFFHYFNKKYAHYYFYLKNHLCSDYLNPKYWFIRKIKKKQTMTRKSDSFFLEGNDFFSFNILSWNSRLNYKTDSSLFFYARPWRYVTSEKGRETAAHLFFYYVDALTHDILRLLLSIVR